MSEPRLAIVTALKEELAAVRAALPDAARDRILIERCGVGPRSAERFVRALLDTHPTLKAICSSGICGALSGTLSVGDCVLPTELVDGGAGGERHAIGLNLALLRDSLSKAGIVAHDGAMLSADAVICAASEKQALCAARRAIVVDMETFGMLRGAGGRAAVFALRTVSDVADESLPPEVAGFVDADGKLRVGAIARFVVTQPHRIGALTRLQKNSKLACTRLTEAWRAAAPALDALLSH
jgi:nucleoside phosphorylase